MAHPTINAKERTASVLEQTLIPTKSYTIFNIRSNGQKVAAGVKDREKESLGLIVLFVPMVSFALLIYGFV